MSKRFLVTGGCGFIGSHLVDYLCNQGHSVVVIDDLSSGHLSNIAGVPTMVEVIQARVEGVDFSKFSPFDGIFHLAAQASVPLSISEFFSSSSTNILSTLKIIDYSATAAIPLVYASSSAVYGNLALGDEGGGLDLLTPYSADKFMAEVYCQVAYKLNGLRSYGLRFFNVYGPRQDPKNPYSGVISIFANRILGGQSITINGGHQTRDFIYVKDVVHGMWNAYLYLLENPVATHSNLLTGNSISINKLADDLIFLTGNKVEKIYRELPIGDPQSSQGTIDRMVAQLNLKKFISLDEGLSEVLSWMKGSHE